MADGIWTRGQCLDNMGMNYLLLSPLVHSLCQFYVQSQSGTGAPFRSSGRQ